MKLTEVAYQDKFRYQESCEGVDVCQLVLKEAIDNNAQLKGKGKNAWEQTIAFSLTLSPPCHWLPVSMILSFVVLPHQILPPRCWSCVKVSFWRDYFLLSLLKLPG